MEQKPNIGKILSPEEDQRDAIHIAIIPVIAGEKLLAGDRVDLNEEGEAVERGPTIGIVDPFLVETVLKGQKAYLFLYPNTITSLKHFWTHPAFDKTPEPLASPKKKDKKSESIEWLKNYAIREVFIDRYGDDRDSAYEAMLNQVRDHELTFQGTDCHGYGDVPDAEELFCHLSIVLDRQIDRSYFEDKGYFSCSC